MLGHFVTLSAILLRTGLVFITLFHHSLVTDAVNHQFYNLVYIQHLEFLIFSFASKPF